MRSNLAWSLGLSLLAFASSATGDEIEQCIADHSAAQREFKAGRLLGGKKLATNCAVSSCPGAIASECGAFVRDAERRTPTVIVVVVDDKGAEVSDVRLTLDGESWLDEPVATSVPLDPGRHTFAAVRGDGTRASVTALVREAERARRIELRFATPPSSASSEPGDPDTEISPFLLPLTVVSGLGFAAFGVFAVKGKSDESDLEACKPKCAQSDSDALRQTYLFADISLGVGIAAAVGAIWVWATDERPADVARGVRPMIRASVGRASIGLTGRF